MGIDGENKKERRALFLRLLEESEINGRYSAPRCQMKTSRLLAYESCSGNLKFVFRPLKLGTFFRGRSLVKKDYFEMRVQKKKKPFENV